jgi:Protein of unknown function (DUF2924)
LDRPPKDQSAADLHVKTAGSGGLNQNDSEASPNGADVEPRATARGWDSNGRLSDRLAVLPELSVANLRLEWRRLFRADSPRLSRDIMTRAIAYRLQEIHRRVETEGADPRPGATVNREEAFVCFVQPCPGPTDADQPCRRTG